MKRRAQIRIYGVVQGVSFRFSAKILAEKMGITGFVKNENDGSVFADIEGEEETLKKFIRWCHYGPANAMVDKVDVAYCEELRNYEIFESIHRHKTL